MGKGQAVGLQYREQLVAPVLRQAHGNHGLPRTRCRRSHWQIQADRGSESNFADRLSRARMADYYGG